MLDWWGLRFLSVWQKKVFFHEFLWFWQFFTNLPYFFAIHRNFVRSEQIWAKALARATNLWSAHTNYGEWWKIGQIREKQSKSKKFVKKHLFCQTRRNLVPINTTDIRKLSVIPILLYYFLATFNCKLSLDWFCLEMKFTHKISSL